MTADIERDGFVTVHPSVEFTSCRQQDQPTMITVHLTPETAARLAVASTELDVPVADLVATAAEGEALTYFRHRKDDPGRRTPEGDSPC